MLAGKAGGAASVDSPLPTFQVDSYVATLLEWNASMNLVSASQATRELVRPASNTRRGCPRPLCYALAELWP